MYGRAENGSKPYRCRMPGDVAIRTQRLTKHYGRTGQVKALAVTSKARSPLLPNVPTLAELGVDVVFAPTEKELYPLPQQYAVTPGGIASDLEGAHRPGHFRGVATVVLKLFNMVSPHSAIFGKKDYQQCLVLTNMVRQLSLPIELILAETVRAKDGLALSSRNAYLSPEVSAQGLMKLASLPKHNADLPLSDYPDLSKLEAFK